MSNPEAIFNTAVNGGQTLSLEIQLDGAAILGSNLPGDLRIIGFPVDAVQEFKLSTNNFAAELGRTGGGVTSFTLKSGTNQIHGSVYEFFRNEVLNANGFFNNLGAIDPDTGKATRVINKQNEYGFTLGGPVIKDKTFAFGYFNGFRYRKAGAGGVISVPTTAFKNGDFSSLGIPIYDPATTRSNGSGGFIRDPFPGNVIPANRISSVAKALQAFLPDPTMSGNLIEFHRWRAARDIDRSMGIQGRSFVLYQAQAECFSGPFLLRRDPVQPIHGTVGDRRQEQRSHLGCSTQRRLVYQTEHHQPRHHCLQSKQQ